MSDQGAYMEGNWLNNESCPSASIVSWTELIISYFWVQQRYWSRELTSKISMLFGLSEVHLFCYGSELFDTSLLNIVRMNSGCSKVGFKLVFKLLLWDHEFSTSGTHTCLKKTARHIWSTWKILTAISCVWYNEPSG